MNSAAISPEENALLDRVLGNAPFEKIYGSDPRPVATQFEDVVRQSQLKRFRLFEVFPKLTPEILRDDEALADVIGPSMGSPQFPAWKTGIAALRATPGLSLDRKDLEYIWERLLEFLKVLGIKADDPDGRQAQAEAIRELYSLHAGPMSFRIGAASGSPPGQFISESLMRRNAPGKPKQNVFLVNPLLSADFGGSTPLDDFSISVAKPNGIDGVYCLAGSRGSGKSTVLNRIEWFCRSWLKDTTKPPLFLRTDLGCSFDSKRFLLDLMADLCREGRSAVQQQPHSLSPVTARFIVGVGYFGRWCSSNLVWAALILLGSIAVFSLGTSLKNVGDFAGNPSTSTTKAVESSDSQRSDKMLDSIMIGELTLIRIGFAASIIIASGLAYYVNSIGAAVFPNRRWQARHQAAACLSVIIILIALSQFIPLLGSSTGAISWLFQTSGGARLVHIWYGFMVFTVLLEGFLPRWWWAYEMCDAQLAALKNSADSDRPDLPTASYVTAAIRLILPKPAALPSIQDVDTAFQHQQVKDFANRLIQHFDRVVLLIDDVDVLPGNKFHDLFRLLRPFSKVPGMCVIVSVPEYFFYAVRTNRLGDVHSTVRDVFLLGDPELFRQVEGCWTFNQELSDEDLLGVIAKIMRHRLQLKVSGIELETHVPNASRRRVRSEISVRYDPEKESVASIKFALAPWVENLKKQKKWENAQNYLQQIHVSRREIIREIDRLLTRRDQAPFDFATDAGQVDQHFDMMKKQYADEETSLLPIR